MIAPIHTSHQLSSKALPVSLFAALARALAFAAIVWHLVTAAYLPVRHLPFGDQDTEAAVRAMNAGYPYQLLYPATENSRPLLLKMRDATVDQGVALLMIAGVSAYQFGSARLPVRNRRISGPCFNAME